MNPERLRAFLLTLELGTVSAAARALWIAQPAVSRRLLALEQETGLTLFSRSAGRLVPTAAAHEFAAVARTLLHAHAQAAAAAVSLRRGRLDVVTVAATPATVRGLLAGYIATSDPQTPAVLTIERPHDVVEAELQTGADIAIVPGAPHPALAGLALGAVPIRAWVAPDHPLAQRTAVSAAELALHRLVTPGARSISRAVLDAVFRAAGVRPEQLLECDDGPTITALAAAGHGVGISTEPPAWRVTAVDLADGAALTLPLWASWRADHFAAAQLGALAAAIRRHRTLHADTT